MKIASLVAGILLGLVFVASGVMVLLKLAPIPSLPEGTPPAHFMAAFAPTGYLTFVKVLEVLGGILVAIPRFRRAGLLVLGPILVNILAFHIFITGGEGLLSPPLLVLCALALFLVWVERRAFAEFLGPRKAENCIKPPA
jgi:putative oxidoreductase